MAQAQNIGQLVRAIFQTWKTAGVDFLVLRNYETLPDFTTNDIDVLIDKKQFHLAEELLISTAAAHQFLLHNRVEFSTLALYFSHPEGLQQVHFDLFSNLKWRGFEYLDTADFLSEKVDRGSFFVPSPVHEAAANLLGLFIYTGRIKDRYKPSICSGFRANPEAAARLLSKTYGASLATFLVKNSVEERWELIEEQFSAIRRALVVRQFGFHLCKTASSLLQNFVRVLKRFLHPPGVMVVLLGADGSGKSTVGAAILDRLQNTFSPLKNVCLHWKPRVFSAADETLANTNPHGQTRRGKITSFFYFAFHWLEFFLGAWSQIRPVLFKGGIVVIDRYYLDLFVDQKRYRMQVPHGVIRFAYVFLKKPDLVLMLDAPAEVLQKRKQEVALQETERQQSAYRTLAASLPNSVLLDAAQPSEAVAQNASRAILKFLTNRTQTRLATNKNG